MDRVDATAGVKDWRLHDLRRTMRSGLAALGVSQVVAELTLGHRTPLTGLVGMYDAHGYADEKRAAWLKWARHVAKLVSCTVKRARRPDRKAAARKLRKGIEWELRDYPARQLEVFTRDVEPISPWPKDHRYSRRTANEAKRLRDLQRLRRITEKFVAESARFPCSRARTCTRCRTCSSPPTTEPESAEFLLAQGHAAAAAKTLLAEIDTALVSPRRRGRPAADDLGLLMRIAERWRGLFDERPTSTPGGKFANVATLVLEHLHGRPPRDISRQLRAALRIYVTKFAA